MNNAQNDIEHHENHIVYLCSHLLILHKRQGAKEWSDIRHVQQI